MPGDSFKDGGKGGAGVFNVEIKIAGEEALWTRRVPPRLVLRTTGIWVRDFDVLGQEFGEDDLLGEKFGADG